MRRFTQLYLELDESNRTTEKVAALERYFREAPPEDAAWGLAFLTGNRPPRAVNSTLLREWAAEAAGIPVWLLEECYDAVGDLSETVALVLPEASATTDLPLHRVVEERLLALKALGDSERRARVVQTWREFDAPQRFVWHKLMLGNFRVGVSRTLVVRALANVTGVAPAEMAHRLMGTWQPTREDYLRIAGREEAASETHVARPYPFYLAHPLEDDPETLGPLGDWQVEWKWDGIRAQVIHRVGEVLIWSRGEELITDRFPEIALGARLLPPGTVLDGEILAWRDERPMPFAALQTRIGRKTVSKKALHDAPAAFVVYDLLECNGEDWRGRPLSERRTKLEQIVAALRGVPYRLSPLVEAANWPAVVALREESRARGVEGFMLKRRDSAYRVGRVRGDWWKWKVSPFTMDAVMIYAQRGSGRRASLYTDYTFGVWSNGELVPIAKAYSGLTDAEIAKVDAWIQRNTLDKHGPVRVVKPELVFELAFEGIQASGRHKAGIAVRFPRILRWRTDKPAAEADTVETLRALLASTKEA